MPLARCISWAVVSQVVLATPLLARRVSLATRLVPCWPTQQHCWLRKGRLPLIKPAAQPRPEHHGPENIQVWALPFGNQGRHLVANMDKHGLHFPGRLGCVEGFPSNQMRPSG